MESFKDEEGKHWDLSLNIRKAKLIKSRFGFDLLADDTAEVCTKLHNRPLDRMDIIYLLIDVPSGETEKISQDDFDERINGESFVAADSAFWREFKNFIQSLYPARAEATNKLLEKMTKVSLLQAKMTLDLASSPENVVNMEKMIEATRKKANKEFKEMVTTWEDPAVSLQELSEKKAFGG